MKNRKTVSLADIRYSFDLTDEGRKFYKTDAQKRMNGTTVGGICVGKAQVVSIDQFSELGDMMGQKISRVTYSYKVFNQQRLGS